MKTTLTTLFFILSISLNFAQSNTAEIIGSVKEAAGAAVPFANILLLHAKDSSLVKGSISQDNGSFSISAVKYGQYLIAVSMVGFTKKYTERFTLSGGKNSLAIEPIILTPLNNQLKEVTVAVKKPFIPLSRRLLSNQCSAFLATSIRPIRCTIWGKMRKLDWITPSVKNQVLVFHGRVFGRNTTKMYPFRLNFDVETR